MDLIVDNEKILDFVFVWINNKKQKTETQKDRKKLCLF